MITHHYVSVGVSQTTHPISYTVHMNTHVSGWVSSWRSGFLPQSKTMQVRSTDCTKLPLRCECECGWMLCPECTLTLIWSQLGPADLLHFPTTLTDKRCRIEDGLMGGLSTLGITRTPHPIHYTVQIYTTIYGPLWTCPKPYTITYTTHIVSFSPLHNDFNVDWDMYHLWQQCVSVAPLMFITAYKVFYFLITN